MKPEVEVTISHRVVVRLRGIPVPIADKLRESFEYRNPAYEKKKSMGFGVGNEQPMIRTWKNSFTTNGDDAISFPRGGMSRVRSILNAANIKFHCFDHRVAAPAHAGKIPKHKVELYPYQREALDAMVMRENALLRAPTGGGKSTIALALAAKLNVPTMVIVWTKSLFDQWVNRATKELGLKSSQVGRIAGNKRTLKPLTIAMQQTLAARGIDDELRDYFGCVICDEVQRFAATTLFDAVDPWPARYRFGISADETRKDGKEFLIYDLFGSPCADIPREQLITSGHVLDVEIKVVPTDFTSDNNPKRIRSMPPYMQGEAMNKLMVELTTDAKRNALLYTHVRHELGDEKQIMVLSQRVEHARAIDQYINGIGFRSGLMLGNVKHHKEFTRTVEELQSNNYRAGVGTVQAIGQGLDIPRVEAGFLATPLATNRQQFGQVRGRMCRIAEGKHSARLYYLWDKKVYGFKHLQNLIKWNTKVVVYHDEQWVDAAAYLRAAKLKPVDAPTEFVDA